MKIESPQKKKQMNVILQKEMTKEFFKTKPKTGHVTSLVESLACMHLHKALFYQHHQIN